MSRQTTSGEKISANNTPKSATLTEEQIRVLNLLIENGLADPERVKILGHLVRVAAASATVKWFLVQLSIATTAISIIVGAGVAIKAWFQQS